MKVEKQPTPEKSFEPFVLKIEIESKEEAQALYAIFNHSRNAKLFPDQAQNIRYIIGKDYSIDRSSDIISNNVLYSEFYMPKS